jgi:hypothetical protein
MIVHRRILAWLAVAVIHLAAGVLAWFKRRQPSPSARGEVSREQLLKLLDGPQG